MGNFLLAKFTGASSAVKMPMALHTVGTLLESKQSWMLFVATVRQGSKWNESFNRGGMPWYSGYAC